MKNKIMRHPTNWSRPNPFEMSLNPFLFIKILNKRRILKL